MALYFGTELTKTHSLKLFFGDFAHWGKRNLTFRTGKVFVSFRRNDVHLELLEIFFKVTLALRGV